MIQCSALSESTEIVFNSECNSPFQGYQNQLFIKKSEENDSLVARIRILHQANSMGFVNMCGLLSSSIHILNGHGSISYDRSNFILSTAGRFIGIKFDLLSTPRVRTEFIARSVCEVQYTHINCFVGLAWTQDRIVNFDTKKPTKPSIA